MRLKNNEIPQTPLVPEPTTLLKENSSPEIVLRFTSLSATIPLVLLLSRSQENLPCVVDASKLGIAGESANETTGRFIVITVLKSNVLLVVHTRVVDAIGTEIEEKLTVRRSVHFKPS